MFLDEHTLDRYPECIERKRFDPNLNQFLAWERLEDGIYLSEDIEWLKHEHHELKFSSGYSDAHNRAQKRYDGNPWDKNNNGILQD